MDDARTVMTEAEIKEIVRQALNNVAPEIDLDSIDPAKDLRDQIDIDSVDFMNLVISLHKGFGIEIPESDVPKLTTLNGSVAYLVSRLRSGGKVTRS